MKLKKIVAAVLSLSLVCGAVPFSNVYMNDSVIYAESEYTEGTYGVLTYKNYGDYIEISDCDESATEVEIPSEIDGVMVKSIGNYSFYKCSALTSITISDSVTYIGDSAFYGCSALTLLTIGNGVTSIGFDAFSQCTSLTSVTIPDSVTSIETWAFYGCSALTEITIPDSVTSIGGEPFNGTPWLEAKQLENPVVIINNNLTYGQACSGDYTIPDGVIKIASKAFSQGAVGGYVGEEAPSGANITSVQIPGTVKEIDAYAFMRCNQLKEVIIHDGVENIDTQAFLGCENIDSFLVLDSDCDMEFLLMAWTFGNIPTVYVIEGSDAHTNAEAIYMESLEYYDEGTFKIAFISDLYGDIDSDSEVNSSDASSVLAEYAKTATGGEKSFSPIQTIAADVNNDGAVDSSDASTILAYYAYTATGGKDTLEEFLG